jgi:multiple sugar transport system permease protein
MTTESARYRELAGSAAAAYPRPAGLSMQQREALAGYLFIAPDFLGLLLFIGAPMILALTMGFFSVDGFGAFTFVGLDNYRKMLIDPTFWQCLKVTALYVVLIVPALYVTGLGLALLVQRTNRFNTVMRAMFFAPQMVSLVVIAVVWQLMSADKQGILARAFAAIGVNNLSLLGSPNLALYTIVFITVWFLMGFYMMIFLGGLQDIPREYYEAAEIDGASKVHRFWYITLPLLRPTSFFILLTSLVAAVAGSQAFDLIYVMTKGGPANATQVMVVYIYQQAFQFSAFGYAAAMASILVVILLLVTGVLFMLTRGGRFSYE